jgi:hypothetical protein
METVESPQSKEEYPVIIHNVGGKEPNGKPTRIGKWTFATKIVRDVVLDNIDGRVLNSCAGQTRLESHKRGVETVRNDLNPEVNADLHVDAQNIDEHFDDGSFDSVVHDPPFNTDRADKLYEGYAAQDYMAMRRALKPLVDKGGTFVELGWNSWGLSGFDDWKRVAHHIYRQPFKADIHLVVDERINQSEVCDF